MITKMLKWTVASEASMSRFIQVVFGFIACVILVVGVRTASELSLTQAQLDLGVGIVLVLVFQCVIVGLLFDNKRKAA